MRGRARTAASRWLPRLLVLAAVGGLAAGVSLTAAAQPDSQGGDARRQHGVKVLPEMPATGNNLRAARAHNSPEMAVHPADGDVVALANRLDNPDFSCALQLSDDGGRRWAPVEPVPQLPDGGEKCYAPEVAFDGDGTLYYLFVALAGGGNRPVGVYLTTSEDLGRTFSEPRQVLGPGNYQVRMALDRDSGHIHLVWLQASGEPGLGGLPPPPNPIMAAHSDDGGATFSEPVQVSDPAEHLRAVAPAVAIGADGALHVAYYDLRSDTRDYRGVEGPVWPRPWSIVHRVSRDGGDTFGPPAVVNDQIQPPERVMLIFTMPPPALATDDEGNVYTAWHGARNGDWDVFAAASGDQGNSWDEPVRVNDDERGNGKYQLLPQLAVAPDGRVDAIFFDRRHDDDNLTQHVYYTSSDDQGETFGPNVRLTRFPSHSRVGAQYAVPSAKGKYEWGLRLGLVARQQGALAAWPDSRHALPGTVGQAVLTTEVIRETRQSSLAPVWWGLVGAVVLGLLALTVWRRRHAYSNRPGSAPAGNTRPGQRGAATLNPIEEGLPPWRLWLVVGMVATLGPLWGLRGDGPTVPVQPQVIELGMHDYAFTFPDEPISLWPGRIVFRAHNNGGGAHQVTLVELPPDVAGVEEWLDTGVAGVVPVYSTANRAPGQQAVFATDLPAGHYGILCTVTDEGDVDGHHHKGMVADFYVGG